MLNSLRTPKTFKTKKRVGRGYGSGKGGHTVGRGQKGQKSRSGYSSPRPGFEGGAMPLSRRIPKLRGFSRNFLTAKKVRSEINVLDLDRMEENTVINEESLRKAGLISIKSKPTKIKILGQGKVNKKFTVESSVEVSKGAQEAIEKAGGAVYK